MVSAHRRCTAAARAGSTVAWSRRALLRGAGMTLLSGAAAALPGCRGAAPPAAPAVTVAALAERYTRLALQLAKHQPSLVEVWLGPSPWAAGVRVPVSALKVESAALLAEVTRVAAMRSTATPHTDPGPDVARLAYVRGQAAALDAAAGRLLGERQTFDDEAQRAFGHVAPVRAAAALDALRQQLSEALPAGTGTLAERHAAFRRAHAVPPTRVDAVFAAAVAWCREAARDLLPLPAGETLTTRVADEAGWAAFSRPTGPRASDLWVSHSGGADAAQLLQLAAHEGTPGHHAQHVLAMADLVEALGWTERALTPAFGPHRLLAEGAAEAGADLLLPLATRAHVCGEVLLPAAGFAGDAAARLVRVERLAAALGVEVASIARDYLDSSMPADAVTTRLRDEALVLDPAGMLAFIEKQRTKVLAYPLGRQLVAQAVETAPTSARWSRFRAITTTLTLGEQWPP